MLLASVDQIRKDLGFDEGMGDIELAITAALNAAAPQIENILDSVFDAADYVDSFYVESPTRQEGGLYATQFRLSTGFTQVTAITTAPYGELIDLLFKVTVDGPQGLVKDLDTFYRRHRVNIAYRAGFQADAANPASYDLKEVPGWLQQAAILKAKILLADSAVLKSAEITLDTKMLEENFIATISRKVRYHPLALNPL